MIFLAKLEKVEFRVTDILCIYKKKTKFDHNQDSVTFVILLIEDTEDDFDISKSNPCPCSHYVINTGIQLCGQRVKLS